MDEELKDPFLVAFKGRFENMLRWEQLDELWDVLREDAAGGWHIYAIGETPPSQAVSSERLKTFLSEISTIKWSCLTYEHARNLWATGAHV